MNLTDEQKEILGIVDNRVDFYFKVENSVIDGYEAEEINPKTGKVEIVEKSYFDNVYELAVYTVLSRYCNNGQVAFPSIPTLAKRCCCGQTSVKNAIKGLEQKGFIKKLNRKKANSAENDTNIYAIKNIEEIVNVGRVATDVGRNTTDGVGRETTGKKNNILNNNNINNKTCNMSSIENDLCVNPKGYLRKDKWEKFINENLIGVDYQKDIQTTIKNLEKKWSEKQIQEYLLEVYKNGIKQNLSLALIATTIAKEKRLSAPAKKIKTKSLEKIDAEVKTVVEPKGSKDNNLESIARDRENTSSILETEEYKTLFDRFFNQTGNKFIAMSKAMSELKKVMKV